MSKKHHLFLTLSIIILSLNGLLGQTTTNRDLLTKMSKELRAKEENDFSLAKKLAKQNGWFLQRIYPNGKVTLLVGVDERGNPRYVTTYNNTIAAATTRANQLWPGGTSGLNLSGSSNAVKGKLAIWDGGHPLSTHVELAGRIIYGDQATVGGHPTHTTGTMIATGINPIAKGMAFGTQQLTAYDFSNDESEMSKASPNLLLSNHSYGFLTGAGWDFDGTNWSWYGDTTLSKSQAFGFGYYNSDAQVYDSIAYHAPNYLICVAAGNARGYNGPSVDSAYLYNGGTKVKRSAVLGNNPNFTSVSNAADSKNTLVVGAVNGIPAGYFSPNDVSIADFSSLGPTNDGRIKPDLVADGVNVTSTWNSSNTSYQTESGTSMATPNTTGSLYLLQEYYNRLHPSSFMRSATLKALAIHTVDEAGPGPGPDYTYGWGLLDVLKAANVITSSYQQKTDTIIENSLNNGVTYTYSFVASGKEPVSATLAWTDPPGNVVPIAQSLNNTTPMLINDLDMRISSGANTYLPWVLDPTNPANAATRGDNSRDNVEKINVDSLIPGQTYTVSITNKGTLARGSQAFSLLVSGGGGQSYCSSAPTSSAGTRIDSVNISNIQFSNTAGCTTYTNNTNQIIQAQSKQVLPIRIKLSSCDNSTASKIVKVFIDYNNNGVFETNELASTSPVISGNGIYTDNISLASLAQGAKTLLRIVAVETTDPNAVQACGSYSNGETQDYTLLVIAPSIDLALNQIIAPISGSCSDSSARVVVGIRNNSASDTMSKVPVTAMISNGSSNIVFNETYPGKIPPGFLVTYTFQNTFNALPGTSYGIKTYISGVGDQNSLNDTISTTVSIAAQPAAPSGTASVSGDTLSLKVNSPNSSANYFWYSSANSDTSILSSADTSLQLSSSLTGNSFYVGSGAAGFVGVASRTAYPNGGGYQVSGGNWLSYTADMPLTLVNAKLYTGNPGKVTIMVVDTVMQNGQIYYYLPALSSTTIDVYTTSSTSSAAARNYDPSDSGAVFNINLPIPAGSHVIMDTIVNASVDKTAIANATIFRNNNVTGNPYPFTIPNVISITGNSATSTSNPSQYQGYYYYLYNMKMQTEDCESARSAVSISGIINGKGLIVAPNPSVNGESFTVSLINGISGNVQIELYDLLGRRCFSQSYSSSGFFGTSISTGSFITGMYLLTARQGNTVYKTKVMILR